MPLARVLEPEVMDSEHESRDYDTMDHAGVNAAFCADLLALSPDLRATLDVGTGTARIPIELCRRAPGARVLGVDLAASMLALGQRNVEHAALSGVVSLAIADAKSMPYPAGAFTCVASNSIVHHIPEPQGALVEMHRVLRAGGWLFVRDLARPADERAVGSLVERYAAGATASQRALFDASLRAALTLDEVRAAVAPLGVPAGAVRMTSDRHWTLAWHEGGAAS